MKGVLGQVYECECMIKLHKKGHTRKHHSVDFISMSQALVYHHMKNEGIVSVTSLCLFNLSWWKEFGYCTPHLWTSNILLQLYIIIKGFSLDKSVNIVQWKSYYVVFRLTGNKPLPFISVGLFRRVMHKEITSLLLHLRLHVVCGCWERLNRNDGCWIGKAYLQSNAVITHLRFGPCDSENTLSRS